MGGALFVESLCTRAVYRAAHCRAQTVRENCVPDLALKYRVACCVREARRAASQSPVPGDRDSECQRIPPDIREKDLLITPPALNQALERQRGVVLADFASDLF
jgi:hypothetical protein